MAKKSKKKSSVTKSKSWVDKVFSFKKILFYALIITSTAFYSSFNSQSLTQVQGASTAADDYNLYSKTELDILAKANPAAFKFTKYLAMELDKDVNKNGVPDDNDSCIAKTYTFKVNGNVKTRTQSSDCSKTYVKVPIDNKCNTVEFVKTNTANPYSFSYLEYETGYYKYKYTNSKKKEVCGYPQAGGDEVGYLYNEVSFGVKAQ